MSTEAGMATLKAAVDDVRRPRTEDETVAFIARAIDRGWISQHEVTDLTLENSHTSSWSPDMANEKIWQLACKRALAGPRFIVPRGGRP